MSDHLIAEANRHAMALPTTHPTHADIAWYVREVSELRAEVEESKARERAAIASWDEERQRALREGGRVVELRAEVERLTARESNQSERIRYLEGATNHATGTPLSQAIARAERAEADLKLLREWQRDVIQNASAHHAERKDAIARAESAEREAFDWKKIARYEAARAERAEADLAFQVARNSDLFTQRDEAFESQEKAETELTTEREKVRLLKARAAIDATMKEDAK